MLQHLERRDRTALLLYLISGAVIVVVGEAGALYLGMAERYGFIPMLARGIVYLLLTMLLWAAVLRSNRRMVIGLMQENRRGYESVLLAYDSALVLKDAYTGGHGHRVARYARLIAKALNLPAAEVDAIGEAALLHDLGKIGMPDHILTKPSRLTTEEFVEVQKHPVAGADILHSIPPLRRHAMAVRHHHEHFDGSGYPDGLRGTQIPLAARIIAVADAFDALTTQRSYHDGCKASLALGEIVKGAGRQFDPVIVDVIRLSSARDALFAAHGDVP
jgi:HD-GYP domain-containing protein (c-di-GMP phosphodiesterase class II)